MDLSKPAKDLVSKNASGQVYYPLDYDVIVFFGLTELRAQLSWKTKVNCELTPSFCLLISFLSRTANTGESA